MIQLIAGGYASAGALGLYPVVLDAGLLRAGPPVAPFVNVSAGVRVGDWWIVVDEEAGCLRMLDPAGGWREVTALASGGDAPCHLAVDASGTRLAVANYGSGTTALFRLDGEGDALVLEATYQVSGSGPVADRQEGPHAHWAGFAADGRLYVVDLGTDQVLAFDPRIDPTLAAPLVAHRAVPGAGPRQLAFHPHLPLAYLVHELDSTVTMLRREQDGRLVGLRTLSTLPAGGAADSLAGAVAIDAAGRRLHVTNRGHDSVATFALDTAGEPSLMGHAPSGGSSPRALLLLEAARMLLVAHEKSGGVTALTLDNDDAPQPTALRADVPGAAFIAVT